MEISEYHEVAFTKYIGLHVIVSIHVVFKYKVVVKYTIYLNFSYFSFPEIHDNLLHIALMCK